MSDQVAFASRSTGAKNGGLGRIELMKKGMLVTFVLLLGVVLEAQEGRPSIALTANSTAPSARIVKRLRSSCPDVTFTMDLTKADFTLEASEVTDDVGRAVEFQLTLFNKDGDAIYVTSPRRITKAVKDVCKEISRL